MQFIKQDSFGLQSLLIYQFHLIFTWLHIISSNILRYLEQICNLLQISPLSLLCRVLSWFHGLFKRKMTMFLWFSPDSAFLPSLDCFLMCAPVQSPRSLVLVQMHIWAFVSDVPCFRNMTRVSVGCSLTVLFPLPGIMTDFTCLHPGASFHMLHKSHFGASIL